MSEPQDRMAAWGLPLSKVLYFFYYGAAAALVPFLTIYYRSVGLSERSIGILGAIPPLMILSSAPFWAGLADTTRQHRRLLTLAISATLLVVPAFTFAHRVIVLLLLVAAYAFFVAPIIPFIDAMVIDQLGADRYQYGKQRLWGALGWGATAFVVGGLAERYGLKWPFYGYVAMMSVTLLAALRLPASQASIGNRFWKGMRSLASDRRWAMFLGLVFLGGMNMAVISNFLFLYINDLNGNRELMGLALAFATLSELPVLFFANRLLERFGAYRILAISLLIYSLRTFFYSCISVAWPVLLIQLLHGPSFSAMWAAGVTYASEIAPDGLGTTAQGIFGAVSMGLGGAAGSLMGGLLYDTIGGVSMFRWVGILFTLVILLLFTFERVLMNPAAISNQGKRSRI